MALGAGAHHRLGLEVEAVGARTDWVGQQRLEYLRRSKFLFNMFLIWGDSAGKSNEYNSFQLPTQ